MNVGLKGYYDLYWAQKEVDEAVAKADFFDSISRQEKIYVSRSIRQRNLWRRLFGENLYVMPFDRHDHFPLPPGWVWMQKPSDPWPKLDQLDEWVQRHVDRSKQTRRMNDIEMKSKCVYFWVRWAIYYAHDCHADGVEAVYKNKTDMNKRFLRERVAEIEKAATDATDALTLIEELIDEYDIDLLHTEPHHDDDYMLDEQTAEFVKFKRGRNDEMMSLGVKTFKRSEVFRLKSVREHLAFVQGLATHANTWLNSLSDTGGAPPVWRRRAFAAHMAAAYYYLTGTRPTSTTDGDFAAFLDAAELVYWDDMDPSAEFPERIRRKNEPLANKDLVEKTAKIFREINFDEEATKIQNEIFRNSYEFLILPATIRKFYEVL